MHSRTTLQCFHSISLGLLLAVAMCLVSGRAWGQTSTTGDIAGAVTDPSGGLVPGARVDLRSLDTGATQSTTSNAAGTYRFSLLKPGRYSITVNQSGFQAAQLQTEVLVGQVSQINISLTLGQAAQTVEVSEAIALLNPEASNNTTFSPVEINNLPSAGGDITNIAFTAPGVVVSVNNDYGNFSVNGLPATSNLFTINGENYMDPYFNINNTGATNLSLGQNELQEATIITNPYNAQYGQFSGAQVTYVTKSGTNSFHGNAQYWWNGRALNANDWFNNYYGEPTPFSNANQWAGSLGGPIIKNRTFFFVDTEGLRFVLPNVISITSPTPAFANAVLNNIQAVQPSEYNTYKSMLGFFLNAPGAASAVPITNPSSCNSLALPGYNPATTPCVEKYNANPSALATEYIVSFRIDQKITDNDTAFFRYRLDHGTQPTYLDPFNSNFNALSPQPQWDAQFEETHVFGPSATNTFTAATSHYVAQFAQNQQLALSTFPTTVTFSGIPISIGNGCACFNPVYDFPQGRNYTQYQFIDDFTVVKGQHSLKFGANFRRYDISDHNFFYNSPRVYYGSTPDGLQNFVDGMAYRYRQTDNLASDVPVAMWGLGLYVNDDWRIKPNFKLTLGLRAERNSNPVCQFNCFANFKGPWNTLPSVTSSNPGSVPYSSDIIYNQHQAFPGVDAVNFSPRIGFSWSPGKSNKTVISGGYGLFYDPFPGSVVDDLLANPPVAIPLRIQPTAGVAPFATGPNGAPAIYAAATQAFNINQTYTQISQNLSNLGVTFTAPSVATVNGTFHAPRVNEWNFQVQRELTSSMSVIVNYAGNHAYRIPYASSWVNAFDQFGLYPGVAGVPANAAVPNYGAVTVIQNGASSNYNGVSVTLRKQFSLAFAAHFNYTWSHALDETSNGGINPINNDSILQQINPLSLRAQNYGNADYDIRHNFSADFVYTPTVHTSHKALNLLLGDWQWATKIFWRSGLPFSVVDGNAALGNFGGSLLGTYVPGASNVQTGNCAAGSVTTPCINSAAFVDASAASFSNFASLSTQTRNQFRGPRYFDTDMSLFRNFKIKERVNFAVGVLAFNVFNHPNFNLPDNILGDATFGQATSMATTPTSPYGNFLGFDSSPRVAQITGKITF